MFRGGETAPLTAGSSNQNDQENSFETQTALKTIENKDKSVENNKNKVKTTTLNLNQKIDPKVATINLNESKVQNGYDWADPAKQGYDKTSIGWTKQKVGNNGITDIADKSSATLMKDYDQQTTQEENQNLEIGDGFAGGIDIKGSVKADKLHNGDKILIASVPVLNSTTQSPQFSGNEDFFNHDVHVKNNDGQDVVLGQIIGDIHYSDLQSTDIKKVDEYDFYLNVTADNQTLRNLAGNVDYEYKSQHFFVANWWNSQYPNYQGMANGSSNETKFILPDNDSDRVYTITQTYNVDANPKLQEYKQEKNNSSWGPQHDNIPSEIGLGNFNLFDSTEPDILKKVIKYQAVDSNGQYIDTITPLSTDFVNVNPFYNIFSKDGTKYSTLYRSMTPAQLGIQVSAASDGLTATDLAKITGVNEVKYSYNPADKSWLICENIDASKLTFDRTLGEEQIKYAISHSRQANMNPQEYGYTNKEELIQSQINHYTQRNFAPSSLTLAIQVTNKTDTPYVDYISNITPGEEVTTTQVLTYTPNGISINAETFRNSVVNYVDEDSNETIVSSDILRGERNKDTIYTVNIPAGYKLSNNNSNGSNYKWNINRNNIIYTFDDDQSKNDNNPIIIRLTHGQKDIVDSNVISEIIHYNYEDGTKAAKDYEAKHVVSSRIGHKDLVTGETIWDSDWSTEIFPEVTSPHINGYTADQAKIEAQTVDGESKDIVRTVVYKANNQKIFIHYVDDDSNGMDLYTDSLIGKSNTEVNYTTRDAINNYLNQGYDLVSDETQGKTLKYDADDEHDQIYNVHLKHHISDVTDPKLLNATFDRVITEYTPEGKDKQITQHYVITRTGTQDQVTKKYTFGNWSSVQVHEDKGDKFDGYTAVITNQNPGDIAEIKDGTPVIKAELFTNSNGVINPVNISETVEIVYNANDQKATVVFIDDDVPKESGILQTKNLVGKSNTKSDYDPGTDIKNYLNKGFELVSDDTKGQPILFDAHDKEDQTFEIHLKHHISDVSDPRILNATFDRVITEHTPEGKDKQITQHYVITRTGTQDQVTKQYKFSDWTVADVHEDKLDSFRGYTAHVNSAKPEDFITIVNGIPTVAKAERFTNENGKLLPKNILETADISYVANPQSAAIVYIDDTADEILLKAMTNGRYDEVINFTPDVSSVIESFVKKGYVLVSDDFDNQKYDADNNQNIFAVHLKHETRDITRSKDVTETIHYVYGDGSKAHDDYVVTKTFENHGVEDLVTGETMWDTNWTPENDEFAQVNSPEISGYTPDKSNIPQQTVYSNSSNLEFTVTYNRESTPMEPTQPSNSNKSKLSHANVKIEKKEQNKKDLGVGEIERSNQNLKGQRRLSSLTKEYSYEKSKKDNFYNNQSSSIKNSQKESQLPQTGENDSSVMEAAGLATLCLSGLFGLGLRKKE